MSPYSNNQNSLLRWFDYSRVGRYVVTICTQDREHMFGEIRTGHMDFNEMGRIARVLWYSLPDRFPGVCLDAFVLMPNHLHGIVVIPDQHLSIENMPVRFQPSMYKLMQEQHPELQDYKPPTLGTIVGAYKGVVTYRIHQSGAKNFDWQNRYWSSVLSTQARLQRARRYINENLQNWEKDKLYKA